MFFLFLGKVYVPYMGVKTIIVIVEGVFASYVWRVTIMMTLKEYAKSRTISYESVRAQAQKYKEELEGHVTIEDNHRVMDDYACNFLDKHRLKRIIVMQSDNDDLKHELERVQEENEELKYAIIELQKELQDMAKKNADLKEDLARTDTLLMLADKEHEHMVKVQDEIRQSHDALLESQKDLIEATEELARYHRTFFGLYIREL